MVDEARLLTRLAGVSPTERGERLEDFITECLAFLCELEPQLAVRVASLFDVDVRDGPKVTTQLRDNVGGNRYDLVIGDFKGVGSALILENKVWSGFSGEVVHEVGPEDNTRSPQSQEITDFTETHQLSRYLRAVSDLPPNKFVGSITVLPHEFVPPPDVRERWKGSRTWLEINNLLEEYVVGDSREILSFVARDLCLLLKKRGVVMEKVPPQVFTPNPGRDALAKLMRSAADAAVNKAGRRWSVRTSSSSTWYLSQPLGLDGRQCLALYFSDGNGELLLGIDPTWLDSLGATCPPDYADIGSRFWGWKLRILTDEETRALKQAATYQDQANLLSNILLVAMRSVESALADT